MHVLTFVYRKHRSVKASSPKLSQFVFVGCYLLITALVLYITAESFCVSDEVRCRLVATVNLHFHICHCLCKDVVNLSHLCSLLQPGNTTSRPPLSGIFISLLVAIEISVIIAWNIADRFAPVYSPFPSNQGDGITNIVVYCTPAEGSNYYIWTSVLLSYSGSVMFASFALAVLTHCYGVPQHDFKANHVLVVVYMLTLTLPLGLGLTYILPHTLNLLPKFLTLCVTLITGVSPCIALLFFHQFSGFCKARVIVYTQMIKSITE